jgi:hypothetical protein
MRYGMLGLYSAVIQALGLLTCIGSLVVGCLMVVGLMRQPQGYTPVAMMITLGGTIGGAFGGLGYAAYGQLLMVWMDVEQNTRLAIRRPILDRLYEEE